MNYIIRKLKQEEVKILDTFLYEAIFIPEGVEAPPMEIINQPELQVYVDDFENTNHQQVVDECIFMIPWGHHIQIINKCNGNTDKALVF